MSRWPVLTRRVRLVLGAGVFAGLLVLIIRSWPSVLAGVDTVGRADGEWLLAGGAAVALTWVAGSCCQLGATTARLPVGRVFATQVAGSFVNHVLPAGFGVAALNLRMLRRCGLSRAVATTAVGLNAAAGFAVHGVALLGFLFVADSSAIHASRGELIVGTAAVAGAVGLGWLAVAGFSRGNRPWAGHLRDARAAMSAALRRPGQALLLWAGSAAVPALHILTLVAVLRALGQPTPVVTLALAYLGASALSAALPTPGGLGGLDVTLLAALSHLGVATPVAVAAIVGYRLLTVWLPLLPGAATLLVLLRWRIV